MRRRFSEVRNTTLCTTDGPLGKVVDLLIDDVNWNVRYLVVTIGKAWSPVNNDYVLIAPASIAGFNADSNIVATLLTSQQVMDSPSRDWTKPISRQYEQALVDHYGWPIYWFGRTVQIEPQAMGIMTSDADADNANEVAASNLRSAVAVCGYRIQSQDGPAGVMRDVVVDVESWVIDFATAEPRTWLPQESSIFPTTWISQVDRESEHISVDLSRAALDPAPGASNRPAMTGELHSARPFRTT